jgi:hypothetical protein
VRFELVQEPLWAHNCHCSRCRKTRGAAFAPNLFVGRDGLRFLQGEQELVSYRPPGAERFTHAFCRRCGSSMPWLNEAHGIMVVPMGSLDDDPGVALRGHIFVDSKATWFTITDDLPQSSAAPGSPPPAARS